MDNNTTESLATLSLESLSLKTLIARQQIWECLLAYTRGLDRLDRELLLSGFHVDAIIDQGSFKGDREAFADWVMGVHREHQTITQHTMTNFHCEIIGDKAFSEAYVTYYGVNINGETDTFAVGRYIDELELRDGRWGIVERVCVTEAATNLDKTQLGGPLIAGSIAISTRDKQDPSYKRPLGIART